MSYLKSKPFHWWFSVPNPFVCVISFRFFNAGDCGSPVFVLHEYNIVCFAGGGLALADFESIGFRNQRRISAYDPFLSGQRCVAKRQNGKRPNDRQQQHIIV